MGLYLGFGRTHSVVRLTRYLNARIRLLTSRNADIAVVLALKEAPLFMIDRDPDAENIYCRTPGTLETGRTHDIGIEETNETTYLNSDVYAKNVLQEVYMM